MVEVRKTQQQQPATRTPPRDPEGFPATVDARTGATNIDINTTPTAIVVLHGDAAERGGGGAVVVGGGGLDDESCDHMPIHTHTHTHTRPESTLRNRCSGTIL